MPMNDLDDEFAEDLAKKIHSGNLCLAMAFEDATKQPPPPTTPQIIYWYEGVEPVPMNEPPPKSIPFNIVAVSREQIEKSLTTTKPMQAINLNTALGFLDDPDFKNKDDMLPVLTYLQTLDV